MSGCFAPGCEREVGPWPPGCSTHWRELPEWLRAAIRQAKPGAAEYCEAIEAARGWFGRQDAERVEAADRARALTRRITGEREE